MLGRITPAPPKASQWLAGQLGASRISASGAGLLILHMQSAKQPLTYRPNHRRGHESWVMGKPGSPSLAFPYASHRMLRPIEGKGVCGGPSEGVRDASSPSLSVSAGGETREKGMFAPSGQIISRQSHSSRQGSLCGCGPPSEDQCSLSLISAAKDCRPCASS